MIEPFLGTWKLESSENFEEYLEQLGEKYHWQVWKRAERCVVGLGLRFTMTIPTLLSFVVPRYIRIFFSLVISSNSFTQLQTLITTYN